MKIKLTIITALFLAVVWTLAATTAHAGRPRPDCPPHAKRCDNRHFVAYDYDQYGRGSDGNQYVRTCHVPARGPRTCGAWIRVRFAVVSTHVQRTR